MMKEWSSRSIILDTPKAIRRSILALVKGASWRMSCEDYNPSKDVEGNLEYCDDDDENEIPRWFNDAVAVHAS
jgi:hypothetical protein